MTTARRAAPSSIASQRAGRGVSTSTTSDGQLLRHAVTLMEERPGVRDVMIEDLLEAFAGGGWG